MSAVRVSEKRLEQIALELTQRDCAIVGSLFKMKLATGNQLVRLHWPKANEAEKRAARRTLKRLVEWRVLARLERRTGGLGRGSESWTYALDTAGQRLIALDCPARRPHLPRPAMWAHVLLGSEIFVRVHEAVAGTDRRVVDWHGEPRSWRTFAGPYGERLRVKPDAFVRIAGPGYEDLYFVEADTGTQSRAVIRAKLEAYRRHVASGDEQSREVIYPHVVFVTSRPARVRVITELVATMPAELRLLFAVGHIDDVPRLFGDPEVMP